MKLIEFRDYQVQPTAEALLIKPIRKLYNADRSKQKESFMTQIAYLYFMVDPRSVYAYITNEEERAKEIIKQEGLPSNFKPSKDLKEAMEVYENATVTTSKRLLQASRIAAEALKNELENTESILRERTDKGARVTKPSEIISMLERLNKVIPQLQDLERKVDSEIKEGARARGIENSMFEDGI